MLYPYTEFGENLPHSFWLILQLVIHVMQHYFCLCFYFNSPYFPQCIVQKCAGIMNEIEVYIHNC